MSGLFGKRQSPKCPLPDDQRKWIEEAFPWLLEMFGEETIKKVKILTPHHTDFPIRYNGDEQTALDSLTIIAGNMEVDPASINLTLYNEGPSGVNTDNSLGQGLYLMQDKNALGSISLYWGKQEDGKYHISLERKKLKEPEGMVAALASEVARIRLLGENRIVKNNGPLTDLTTILFGLGIFNANASFRFYQDYKSWGYSKEGYLSQMEWGYGLALFAAARKETDPGWLRFLTRNIQSDFKKSMDYLRNGEK